MWQKIKHAKHYTVDKKNTVEKVTRISGPTSTFNHETEETFSRNTPLTPSRTKKRNPVALLIVFTMWEGVVHNNVLRNTSYHISLELHFCPADWLMKWYNDMHIIQITALMYMQERWLMTSAQWFRVPLKARRGAKTQKSSSSVSNDFSLTL